MISPFPTPPKEKFINSDYQTLGCQGCGHHSKQSDRCLFVLCAELEVFIVQTAILAVNIGRDKESDCDPLSVLCSLPITTLHHYDSSGNPIAATDADGHLGCTSGSAQASACANYDSFDTHLVKALKAKNQAVSYQYSTAASGGNGQWLLSTTDANGNDDRL